MPRPLSVLILIVSLLLPAAPAHAQDDIVEKTYCTQGIAYESIDALKRDLLLNAKREAVNSLFGELIATSTAVENFVLTSDQIRTSSLGLVRINGDISYFNSGNFAEVCVSISVYTTEEDRLKFEPIKLSKRNCVTEPNLTTREITEVAKQQAVIQALLDYDRKLEIYEDNELLKLMQRINYTESGFVSETETYCIRVEGYITPIEILTLLELNPVTGTQVAEIEKTTSQSSDSPQVSGALTFRPVTAFSFQNEGTAGVDDTDRLLEQDDIWAPSQIGSVKNNYYANANGADWFDAVSVNFNVDEVSIADYTPILRFYVQHGDYQDSFWNHYILQKGRENQEFNDTWPPTTVKGANSIDYTIGKWIEVEIPPDLWTDKDLWITLRLWNVRMDAIELQMTPKLDTRAIVRGQPDNVKETEIISPTIVFSFQNEGTDGVDDTELLLSQDKQWAPSQLGSVTQDYYTTGNSAEWFDALSVNFALAERELEGYTLKLRFYAQHGDYRDSFWNHYLLQQGKENQENDSWPPTEVEGAQPIDFTAGKWIEVDVPKDYWTENELWLTLRLWNVRVDAIQLQLTPIETTE